LGIIVIWNLLPEEKFVIIKVTVLAKVGVVEIFASIDPPFSISESVTDSLGLR
jgi:hypothetical protein